MIRASDQGRAPNCPVCHDCESPGFPGYWWILNANAYVHTHAGDARTQCTHSSVDMLTHKGRHTCNNPGTHMPEVNTDLRNMALPKHTHTHVCLRGAHPPTAEDMYTHMYTHAYYLG